MTNATDLYLVSIVGISVLNDIHLIVNLKCITDFSAFTGIEHLSMLTLNHLMLWVKELRARGWAWDTRRHALSYLRRATKMGTRVGIPDVVAGMRIDYRDQVRTPVRVWTLTRISSRPRGSSRMDTWVAPASW